MPKYITAWTVGSAYIPLTTVEVDNNPSQIAAGHYYLRHTTDALDLLFQIRTQLDGILGDGVSQVFIAKDRRVRISAPAPFNLEWPTSLSSLLGFTGNLIGQSTYTAPSVSPILWSASKPETPQESPLGTLGRKVFDNKFSTSPDTYQLSDGHHTHTVQTFAWSFVPTDRWQTIAQDTGATGTLQGEYTRFFQQVLVKAEKFWLYRAILEDTDSSEPVVWTDNPLGPYGYRPAGRGAITWDFARAAGFKEAERRVNVSLDCLVTREWGT